MRRTLKLHDPKDESACYELAVRMLGSRSHSRVQLARKLTQRGYDVETVEAVLQRLAAAKWLDEAKFADDFVRGKIRKQHGRLRIERELQATGVSRGVVTEAVRSAEEAAPERERLEVACQRKLDSLVRRYGAADLAEHEGRKKLASFLLKQGYAMDDVFQVVDQQLKALGVSTRDAQENDEPA